MTTKHEELKSEGAAVAYEPQGQRQAVYISPAWLLDDPDLELRGEVAGKQRPSQRCGLIWGAIGYGIEHPNQKEPTKNSIRWVGDIGFQKRDGTLGEASTAYLPKPVEADLKSACCPIIREGEPPPDPFIATFSVECWLEPVSRKISPGGFGYATYNRMGRRRSINHLAPPEIRALLPVEPEPRELLGYDPETGEIEPEAERDAAQ